MILIYIYYQINEANNVFGISNDCDAAIVIIICEDEMKAMEVFFIEI